MRVALSIEQMNKSVSMFKEMVSKYEVIKSFNRKAEIEVLNGYLTLTIKGEYYEYSIVFDTTDNMTLKGFAYNPF